MDIVGLEKNGISMEIVCSVFTLLLFSFS